MKNKENLTVHACMLSCFSRVQLSHTLWTVACQTPLSIGLSSKNTGVGSYFLLQEIFSTQGSNLCLLHWRVGSLPLARPGTGLKSTVVCSKS